MKPIKPLPLGYGKKDPSTGITTIHVEGIGIARTALVIQKVTVPEGQTRNPQAPSHRALVGDVEVGAFWAKRQQTTDIVYLSGYLRGMLFPRWEIENVQIWEVTEGEYAGCRRLVAMPPRDESTIAPVAEEEAESF